MVLTGVHHTGLVVSDLERSIAFYHDVLGLEFYNEPTPWFTGPGLATGVGVPGAELRQVTLWAGPSSTVELLEYRNPPQTATQPIPNNQLGAAHICFTVDDVHGKKSQLEDRGVRFYGDVNVVDDGPLSGWRWVYFSDPDGLTLELVEIAYYPAEERQQAIAAYLTSRPRQPAV